LVPIGYRIPVQLEIKMIIRLIRKIRRFIDMSFGLGGYSFGSEEKKRRLIVRIEELAELCGKDLMG